MAIVAIIVVGSYLAYKNGVFADTSARCTYVVTDLTPGANYDSVYLATQADTNAIVANPRTSLNFAHQFTYQGESFPSGANNYSAIIHKVSATGTVTPKVSSAKCTQSGTWEIAANLATGSIDTRFYAALTPSPTPAASGTYCIAYQGASSTYTRSGDTYTWTAGNSDSPRSITQGEINTHRDDYSISNGACNAGNANNANSDGSTTGNTNNANTTGSTQVADGSTRCIKIEGVSIQLLKTGGMWKPNPRTTDAYAIPEAGIDDATLDSWLRDTDKQCASNSNPLVTTTGNTNNANSNGSTPSRQFTCYGVASVIDPTSKIWNWYSQNDAGKWQKVDASGNFTGPSLDGVPGSPAGGPSAGACGTPPAGARDNGNGTATAGGAATQTVPGCATGYSCYAVGGSGTDNVGCYKTSEASQNPSYTSVPASRCSHQEATTTNPSAIGTAGVSQTVIAPVSGAQANAPVQYPNRINFTAYRVSYAETGQIVPMGGVTFNIQSLPSASAETMSSISGLQASAGANGITPAGQAKCSWMTNFAASTYGRINNNYYRSFTTPDNGSNALYTQTINVPPGFYRVSYRKNGFNSTPTAEQTLCFQVGSSDGVSTPVSINALLYAQPGAEPPGLMNTNGNGGVRYDNTINGRDEYKTEILNSKYKYMPDYPWYGWQKEENYNDKEPIGTTSAGLPVPGIPANYGTGTNIQQYLSQCQNAGIQLGNVDRGLLPWVGGIVAAADGIRNNESFLEIAGRTGIGIGVGLALGAISSNSNVNVSINFGQYNAQCQALYNSAIPAQCQSCFINGTYNASTCPATCIQQIPYIQTLLQGNSASFGNN